MKIYLKRFLIFALTALLIIAPPVSYANTSIGGWTALDTITAGATNTINAVKGAGATGMRSAVAVAPSVVKVGKHLIKGGGAAALLLAVPQLLGEGVDWVLDPANNAVKYTETISGGQTGNFAIGVFHKSNTPEGSCRSWAGSNYNGVGFRQGQFYCKKPDGGIGTFVTGSYTSTEPDTTVEKYLPISDVAAQVISNAEAGHAPSQEAVKATALEGFAAGEHDAALEAAAVPDTGVENPPDTENPPKDPDAPAEPFDPAGIISAINALKALLAGILSSITGLSDFFQSEPPAEPTPTDTEVIIDSPLDDFDSDKSYITFTGSCPPNYTASLSIMGNTVPFSFDYAPICTVMSALKPFIVGAGYLSAAYIISGVGRSTSKE